MTQEKCKTKVALLLEIGSDPFLDSALARTELHDDKEKWGKVVKDYTTQIYTLLQQV